MTKHQHFHQQGNNDSLPSTLTASQDKLLIQGSFWSFYSDLYVCDFTSTPLGRGIGSLPLRDIDSLSPLLFTKPNTEVRHQFLRLIASLPAMTPCEVETIETPISP